MTDLSSLSAPEVIEQLDYDALLSEYLDDLQAKDPELTLTEADPAYKVLEVAAYRELLIRQSFNERLQAMLLAYASGSDLDHIGVTYYQTERLLITPGDPSAVPPVDPVYETDDAYLQRLLLSESGQSTAGPRSAYKFHALSADGQIKDVGVSPHTPDPGNVTIALLSHTGDGTTDQALIDIVQAALDDEDVRPLNDTPVVQSAAINNYTINATLTLYRDSDEASTLAASQAAITKFTSDQHRVGHDITLDGVYAALRVPGVQKVTLNNTVGSDLIADLASNDTEAPYCTGIIVDIGGFSDE